MVSYRLIAFAGLAAALPLNINLGAYSPALVVGDGEISFGGATTAAAGGTTAAGTGTTTPAAAAAPAVQPAATPATAASAASVDPNLSQQAQQIAALQGMGKEIAPRVEAINAPNLGKRDLTGFDRALKYAEAALVKGPKIQLGTGEGGAGVGIIVDNNPTAAARAGTGGTAAAAAGTGIIQTQAKAKRDVDESSAPRRRSKVTTMYVRRGVPPSLQSSSEVDAREVDTSSAPVQASAPLSRRDAIDAVNLNVDGNTGVTMTFVETVEDGEAED